jgi:hypothetical protein
MTRELHSAPLDQLCDALNAIGDALADLDLDRMLAAEPQLRDSMAALTAVPLAADKAAVKAGCDRARTALLRCRRLGASFSRAARSLTGAATAADAYDKSGAHVDSAGLRAVLQLRA